VSLGSALQGWLNVWGGLLIGGVVVPGILIPLAISWRHRHQARPNFVTVAMLVLVGGFLLRVVVIFSSEMI
jgi:formate-dependent nitrite reductase membrane component NrfD